MDTIYNFGILHEKNGKMDDAEHSYRTALQIAPTHRQAWNALGVLLFRKGDLAGAAESFRAALHLDPANEGIRKNLEMTETLLQSRR